MTVPKSLQKYPEIDLKLGIKSSLPSPKSTIALFLMLWESTNRPATLIYSQPDKGGGIVLSDKASDALITRYKSVYSSAGIQDSDFLDKINENQLFKSQLEALIVAFSLVWRLGIVQFIDNKPSSAERTGGQRYPKNIIFTKNMDLIHISMESRSKEYDNTLLNWIGFDIPANSDVEASLLNVLVNFSEEAVFKLTASDGDIIFNNLGFYEQLLDGYDPVDVKGTVEPKGSLRILRSALNEEMFPFISYSDRNGVSLKNGAEDFLSQYATRVNAYLSLSNSKHLRATSSDSTSLITAAPGVRGRNVLLYGVPGSGKSYTIKTQYCDDYTHMEKVVFHPDFTNSDFVGQILPTIKEDDTITYEFVAGPFTRILKKAFDNPQETFFLVIEEINRGNAPAIFGEVFQLLDRDDTGRSTYAITNRMIADVVFNDPDEPVYLPSNLWVLATMNTADQNVFTLDTAFQRRWDMKMIENDVSKATHAKTEILDTGVSWETFCKQINSQILSNNSVTLSSEDKRLGAYFITEDILQPDTPDKKTLFAEKVIKYLWDDAFKFNRENIFSDRFQSLEEVIKSFSSASGFNRFQIFSNDVQSLLRENLRGSIEIDDSQASEEDHEEQKNG